MGKKDKKKRVHIIIISICLIAYFLNIEGREGRESLQGLIPLSPNHIPVAEERKEKKKKTPNIYASQLNEDHIISPGDLLNLKTRGKSSPCLPEYFPSRTTKLISLSLPPSLIHSFIHPLCSPICFSCCYWRSLTGNYLYLYSHSRKISIESKSKSISCKIPNSKNPASISSITTSSASYQVSYQRKKIPRLIGFIKTSRHSFGTPYPPPSSAYTVQYTVYTTIVG